ncbi:MAG: hypothetical protein HFJ66_09970 [Eggerthellaceae bacterium]|nr:hypothetical protein [Eggerthellaceae bacterium]
MIDFLSSPFSLVSVGLGVLAIAIIGMVAWVLSIDRRTRGMVDSLEQERRKVAEMQVFLSRRGNNDAGRRAPRTPQSGAAVGARPAGQGSAAAGAAGAAAGASAARPQGQPAGAVPGSQAAQYAAQQAAAAQRGGAVPVGAGAYPSTPGAPQAAAGRAVPGAGQVAGRPGQYGQVAAASPVAAQASAREESKPRGRAARGAVNVPYGKDQTAGAGYAGLDQRSEAQARAMQAARIRQQAAREAQMRAAQQAGAAAQPAPSAAQAASASATRAAQPMPAQARPAAQPQARAVGQGYPSGMPSSRYAAGPSEQTSAGVRYVPSDPAYQVVTPPARSRGYGEAPASPVDGKRSMPWTPAGEPRGRHAR